MESRRFKVSIFTCFNEIEYGDRKASTEVTSRSQQDMDSLTKRYKINSISTKMIELSLMFCNSFFLKILKFPALIALPIITNFYQQIYVYLSFLNHIISIHRRYKDTGKQVN